MDIAKRKPNTHEVLIQKKKKSVAGQVAAVKYRSETYLNTKLNREDYGVDK